MSRKKTQPKKNVVPDPKYNSTIIPKLINNIMYDGKRGVAAKIVYDAIDKIKTKSKDEPINIFNEAINNIKPTVEVSIDTNNWVITNVTTKIDTLKLIEINNKYELIKNTYFMPIESKVEYYVKDARLTKWINRDLNVVMGSEKNFEFNNDIVRGFIQVQYFNHRINKGIDDKIFKE